jgi:hypothetical protein
VTQKTRILIGIGIVIILVIVVLGVDWLRRQADSSPATVGEATLVPGSIPIYMDAKLIGGFRPEDLERLDKASFTDAAEGKEQDGWLLRDVLLLYIEAQKLNPHSRITVSSSSRGKSAQLTWAEVDDSSNWVMFDLTNRGTLKLVSVLERLSTRDQWLQDADKIEVETQPHPTGAGTP